MRVLIVVHGFPPLAHGGSEIHAHRHVQSLVRLFGDTVLVLTREQDSQRPEYAVRTEERDDFRIAWINNTFREVRTFEESYRNAAIAGITARLAGEFRPDIVHVHHLTCLSTDLVRIFVERRIPVVLTLHDYWLLCHRGQLLDVEYRLCQGPEPDGCQRCIGAAAGPPVPSRTVPALRAIERGLPTAAGRFVRGLAASSMGVVSQHASVDAGARRLEHMRAVCDDVTHFLAPSRSVRDRFMQFGIAPGRISLAPYGLNLEPFRNVRRSRSGTLRIGFVGTLMVSKAPHLLLEAHRRLPPGAATVELFGAYADYHGETGYRRVLEPLLSGPDVHVHGARPHDGIPDALGSIDVLVMPSVWPETSGLVIQEAFLAGIPVVASRIGGIPEVVEHGRNGLLFEPGSVDDLHRTLGRLLDEPGLLAALSAGALATTVRDIDDDVRFARGIYESCMTARHTTPVPRQRLAAIVLNHRTADDTLIAVSSLLASKRRPDEVILVDNDVSDELRARVLPWGSAVTYVHTGRNLGFSGGMNAGIRVALERGADLVLLVNSDVIVPPSCLERLEATMVPESRIPSPESPRVPDPESRVPDPGSRIPDPESRSPSRHRGPAGPFPGDARHRRQWGHRLQHTHRAHASPRTRRTD